MKNTITKREMYEAIKETFETGSCKFEADVVIEFCEKEIASLDTKAAKAKERAATKAAEADTLTGIVADVLVTDEYKTIADITAAVVATDSDVTASKITYRLTSLVKSGVAEKAEVTVPGADGGKTRKVMGYRLIG